MRFDPRDRFRPALLAALAIALLACNPLADDAVTGRVNFVRDVSLPEGAVLIVTLNDVSLADAPAMELGRTEIDNPGQLPIRFSVAYDPAAIEPRNEYSLQARVQLGEKLLYINDTVHPVLTGGAPSDSDIRVISVDPNDHCREPLPVRVHSAFAGETDLAEADIRVRLIDVSNPGDRVIVTESRQSGIAGEFPIELRLPHEGVSISRHSRYELEAEIWIGGELVYHIPNAEWRMVRPSYCPDAENMLVIDVFPVGQFADEAA